VGVRPKDGSENFSPFGAAKIRDGPVGVRAKDGSAFSPFQQGGGAQGGQGVRAREPEL